jgi:aspartate kinase
MREGNGKAFDENSIFVDSKFNELFTGLGGEFDPASDLAEVRRLAATPKKEELVSRGEYICAKGFARHLGFEFVDAKDFMRFDQRGDFDLVATKVAWNDLNLDPTKRYVIPGFYGVAPNGEIKLLSRNASDLTGATVAACAGASVFEKWGTVAGIYRADPKLVSDAEVMDEITFEELREFTDMGAKVLHPEVTGPLREMGIPMRVRDINNPQADGTRIVLDGTAKLKPPGTIIGISHRKNCIIIDVKKFMMGVRYAARVLTVFADVGIDVGHLTDGTDIMSMTVGAEQLENGKLAELRQRLQSECNPDSVNVHYAIAALRVVGHWMNGVPGTAGRVYSALGRASISNKVHGQPTSEIGMFIAVDEKDCDRAVKVLYDELIRNHTH